MADAGGLSFVRPAGPLDAVHLTPRVATMWPVTTVQRRVFSGIQPTGQSPHLGNYLGATRRWAVEQQPDDLFCVVDLHAMTIGHDPDDLRRRVLNTAAWLMAMRMGSGRSIVFAQSAVPAHTELMWLLMCQASFGDLTRMTQFKEKGQANTGAGIFAYPVLMAADILLYRASHVPIGDDQSQHLELARTLVKAINRHVGKPFFPLPETNVSQVGARIRDLKLPDKKMSKSSNSVGTVWLMDDEARTRSVFMRATTDSVGAVRYAPEAQPGVANLIEIAAAVLDATIDDTVAKAPARYGELKEWVAELVNTDLRPVRTRFQELAETPAAVMDELEAGAARARHDAEVVMGELRTLVGYVNA